MLNLNINYCIRQEVEFRCHFHCCSIILYCWGLIYAEHWYIDRWLIKLRDVVLWYTVFLWQSYRTFIHIYISALYICMCTDMVLCTYTRTRYPYVSMWHSDWHMVQQSLTRAWFNIKMPSYQYRKSHCGDKTVVRSSYLHNGVSYTGKMVSLYWIRALFAFEIMTFLSANNNNHSETSSASRKGVTSVISPCPDARVFYLAHMRNIPNLIPARKSLVKKWDICLRFNSLFHGENYTILMHVCYIILLLRTIIF